MATETKKTSNTKATPANATKKTASVTASKVKVQEKISAAPAKSVAKSQKVTSVKRAIPAGTASFRVKLVRSPYGHTESQKATIRGLGLKKIGQERELIDTPSSRGMARTVRHLVKVI